MMAAAGQVLVENGIIFGDECPDSKLNAELKLLMVRCQNTMAVCAHDLISTLTDNPSILTDLLALVLENKPKNRGTAGCQWFFWWQSKAGCFETSADGHLYHINALTGTVLVDGSPLRRLGEDILQHALYRYR